MGDAFWGGRTRKHRRPERAPGTGSAIAAMSSDFESYEQDFAVLTAEITGRIGKVPKLVGGERLLSAPAALAPQARPARP